ncbi:HEPN domain-containing protein [Sphingomonas sp.]|uniref:HEPN domain-containing protein n=1 Tax=Sphingomonas sp. TaxID=28214 RepID=UPI00286C43D9|nr:HEPN domain-containing protein [Sphingomonas sp.]
MTEVVAVLEDGPEFEAMMCKIDAGFVKNGTKITARPLIAAREVSLKYGIAIPITDPVPGSAPELKRYAALSNGIQRWYKDAYGDRLNVDMSPGRVVLNLDGDLYQMTLLRFWGTGEIIVTRQFISPENDPRRGFRLNLVQLIDHMTEPKARTLSDKALRSMIELFPIGLAAAYHLEAGSAHPLIKIAQSDMKTAVSKLMDRGEHFGDSKWATLQAAEKCFKASLDVRGGTPDRTHKLRELRDDLAKFGVTIATPSLIDAIQCSPSIRYGDEPCSMEEALAAHHAVLRLVVELVVAGSWPGARLAVRPLGTQAFQIIRTE